ncbi:histidine phosphatase family protein [Amylibacter sp. SFDW26]|nr:histidine phosphatase family protein [Amylibacter sp. SFDW26]
MRHAKSSWDNLDLSDHDRTLNDRGRKSAVMIGNWLVENNYVPDQVICSTAVRCMETWAGLKETMGLEIEPTFDRSLYHAHGSLLREKLTAAHANTVLFLCHNPGVSAFAEELLESRPKDRDLYKYPTAATTVIDFDIADWSELSLRSGKLEAFIIPRRLG